MINFTLTAKEIVPNSPKKSIVPVTVYIKDQNDNYPEFSENTYEVHVPEDCETGTTVAWLRAFDEDSGNYGTKGIRYTSLGGSLAQTYVFVQKKNSVSNFDGKIDIFICSLTLDYHTGLITVKQSGVAFDRELASRHYLTVEARDDLGKGNRNTAQLIVNIVDVNDNAPTFLQNKYEAVLLENEERFDAPLVVEAFDVDLNGTRNSEILYSIVSSDYSRNFTIDSKRGIITPSAPMDFEALPIIVAGKVEPFVRPLRLTIRARDLGTPSLSSDVAVIVYFKDVNDNAPSFERAVYKKNVLEDLPGGTSVLQVSLFYCSILNMALIFFLNQFQGKGLG